MAKRYTQTDKFGADWFIGLSKNGVLLHYYLNDACDHAGFYKIGYRHIETFAKLSQEEAIEALNELDDKIVWSDDNSIIWLKDFLEDQANIPLNKHNNAHKGIIAKIRQHSQKFHGNIDLFKSLPCKHIIKGEPEKEETLGEYLSKDIRT